MHADRLDDLREDVARELGDGALGAAEEVRRTWRALEEFNLNPSLALEATVRTSAAASSGGPRVAA